MWLNAWIERFMLPFNRWKEKNVDSLSVSVSFSAKKTFFYVIINILDIDGKKSIMCEKNEDAKIKSNIQQKTEMNIAADPVNFFAAQKQAFNLISICSVLHCAFGSFLFFLFTSSR